MKKLFFTLTTILITYSSFAANIDWTGNGGNGNWNLATNWSTGTVPTSNDDVTIGFGSVFINGGVAAFAKSFYIRANATLTVKAGASLTISGSDKGYGLSNYGQLIVRGLLDIIDVTDIPSKGLYNFGSVEILSAGVVQVEDFYYGIDNWGSTNNLGLIDIANSITGIQQFNSGNFINGQTGILSMNVTGTGISQLSNSIFTNDGNLDIISTGAAVGVHSNKSTFTNSVSGTISINAVDGYGIYLLDGGTFTNRGVLTIDAQFGVYLYNLLNQAPGPAFINSSNGNLVVTAVGNGIATASQLCAITNTGKMEITSSLNAINNSCPSFINNVCAEMLLHGKVYNSSTGVIQNNAKWVMDYSQSSYNAGSCQNLGILEDNYGGLSPLITNSRLVVRPITGPLVDGLAVANVLDVVSWGIFQAVGIYTDAAATISAGTYVQATNTFTPNAAAVGLASLYVKIKRGANGCPAVFRIAVQNPVPIIMPGGQSNTLLNFEAAEGQYTVFPNPTTGQFSLKGGLTSGPVEAVIFDAYGRDVFRQIIDFQTVGTVGFEQGLLPGAGIYFLKIMENGSPLWQERLVFTGN